MQFWRSLIPSSLGIQWVKLPSQNYSKFHSEKVEDVEYSCIGRYSFHGAAESVITDVCARNSIDG